MDDRLKHALYNVEKTLESRQQPGADPFAVLCAMAASRGTSVMDCIISLLYLKLARLDCGVSEQDSLIDLAGYAVLALAWIETRDALTN